MIWYTMIFMLVKIRMLVIVGSCGVHTDGEEDSQHNGIHRFFISKNAKVRYEEKHVGIGEGTGKRIINPQTYIEMAEKQLYGDGHCSDQRC